MGTRAEDLQLGTYKYGWSDESKPVFEPKRGLSEDVVREISALKSEPKWMLDLRLKSLKHFRRRPMPNWGGDLSGIDFENIYYFIRSTEQQATSWDELPDEIRETYDRLGLPEAEKQRLVAGVAAQYECLTGDARVWTANRGLVPIKNIEAGDQVFALDEETGSFVVAPVKGGAQTDVRQTYEVTVNGQTIRATDNHPFFTRKGWRTVADLRPGDEVGIRVGSADHVSEIQHESAVGTLVRTDLEVGFAPVTAIEAAEVEPVYDIEVDGPHNFVAEGMVVHNSEVVYHKVREDLEAQGVLFLDTDTALKQHEDLFREHFTKVIPANDNKFAALNTAVWSGGSFIWVPEGVKVDIPLQAYFRINQQNMGQFERTLIIAEPGSYIHYVEGCLPAGELVGTADGDWRGIETIEVGEHVLTHEGRPARVTAVQIRDHRGPLYTFQPTSPDSAFRVTGEHPLLVAGDGGEPDWIEAKDVHEGDQLVFPKPKPAPAETVLPLDFARLAGYYLAFGSATIVDGTKRVLFSLPADDGEPLEEIRRLSKDLYEVPGTLVWDESTQQVSVVVESPAAYEALRHLGTGAADKRLPGDLYRQDTKFQQALLETYLRGHECAVRQGAIEHRARAHSRTWARQLQAVLARVGVFASVSSHQDAHVVEWATGGRGTRKARDAGDYFLVPLNKRTVEEFDGQVYNLDVEAPDSYLASGFAVHNCTAPIYSSDSLHSAVVEIIVKPGARVRYTTIQNWSNNVYNLVTKRAAAYEDATMEWVDANIGCLAEGSRVTTRSGVKPIEELTPGEEVLSYDQERGELCFRTVTAKKYSGEQSVRAVSVGDHRLLATDNHPFFGRGPAATAHSPAFVRADAVTHVELPDADAVAEMSEARGPVAVIAPARLRTIEVSVSEHIATVPTWDIEVEGTSNFVAEGFIVHNSKLTMKYPAVWLMGRGAKGDVLSVAFAGDGQHQDAGAKMVHHAPDTSSNIVSKSVSQGTGRTSYRGLVDIEEGANRVKANVVCDALLLDETARSDTYPYMSVREDDAQIGHEASVSKVGEEQLFYLQSRGIEESEALAMIVRGFIEPIAKELPMEYAVELNRLISLNMEGSVG